MSENFEKLREIGAQKIHERTHISKNYVQALLHSSFETMSRVQFLGFVSILEREYHLDLSDLRQKGLNHFNARNEAEQEQSIFVDAGSSKSMKPLYIGMLIFVVIVALLGTIFSEDGSDKSLEENQTVLESNESNESNISLEITDMNATAESNLFGAIELNSTAAAAVEAPPAYFALTPRGRVWIGYINLESGKKFQTTTSDKIELDANTTWALTLGHGKVSFEINGEQIDFDKIRNLRFLYKDGKLEPLSFEEYKQLNRGNVW